MLDLPRQRHSVSLPVSENALPTVSPAKPRKRCCCRSVRPASRADDSLWSDMHAVLNTSNDNTIETRSICHGGVPAPTARLTHALAP